MRCKKAKIMISAALDGELRQRERLVLERHLASCETCAVEKAELSALRDTMLLWADETPSEWLAESFAHKLRQLREQPARERRPRWVFGTAAAGLATATLVLIFFLQSQIQPPTPISPPEQPTAVNTQPVIQPAQPKIIADDLNPAPLPKPEHIAAQPKRVAHIMRPTRYVQPASRNTTPASRHVISESVVVARVAEAEPMSAVTDRLGEAGLAVNSNIERVRGTLRKAADLMVAQRTEPIGLTSSNGGNTL